MNNSIEKKRQFADAADLRNEIATMNLGTLRAFAREYFDIVPRTMKRQELADYVVQVFLGNIEPEKPKKSGRPTGHETPVSNQEEEEKTADVVLGKTTHSGILIVMPDGFGFLRTCNYSPMPGKDIYVPPAQIRRFALKTGDKLTCDAILFKDRSAPSLTYIHTINDATCDDYFKRVPFDTLISCYPNERLTLETDKTEYALRAIDLVSPVGKGQRGLIVAPPKAGKTVLLKKIAQAIRRNHPDVKLTVLLIDERPEEVTDFRQSVDCDVVYSTFDQSPTHHVQMAELVIANARRRVEQGQDVMILLDSITRLARAYNQVAESSGRTLTGGLDISALSEPKKLFGAGRNVEGGGSLTILATALVDTGSRMDDIIYEEFKGTGNMEIHLDRRLSEKRIFPAIDLEKSGTRREDLLLTQKQLEGMYLIRKKLSAVDKAEATEELIEMLTCTPNNDEFIDTLKLVGKKKTF